MPLHLITCLQIDLKLYTMKLKYMLTYFNVRCPNLNFVLYKSRLLWLLTRKVHKFFCRKKSEINFHTPLHAKFTNCKVSKQVVMPI